MFEILGDGVEGRGWRLTVGISLVWRLVRHWISYERVWDA